ncbi:DUF4333 domain-containing protein [Nocardioides marmorisolisilvae]|uniref:DUF4333 domain-containing protein n=1 Tax=Nocardioides marmorisolisilvae TaxID=1542737 RepID=A0A3N0DS26_9ACTN|nr:DUF4333 domain-containing protein [Nocardioides marmorisolisilvae]RNL78435.1 DUF4333 domain-containing protein [Nocardioides marmorisolisilvae]
MTRRLTAVALAAGLTVAVTGCTKSVPANDLEKQVKSGLTKSVGQAPDSVDCPKDLKGKVGATARCTLKAEGKTYGLTVTVTSVDGGKVKFDIKVDDSPKS